MSGLTGQMSGAAGLDAGARIARRLAAVLATGAASVLLTCACGSATGRDTVQQRDARERHDALAERRIALARSLADQGIRDSTTLAAVRSVPRHEFVPAALREFAYEDAPLPIAHEQTISQPFIVAAMTEALRPRPGMKVLEVGTGSGYQAAVLAAAGCRVYTIEIVRALADSARVLLGRLGYGAVQVRHGDGYLGWPEAAPFDGIVVTAAPESLPPALVAQLASGGRLVAPVGPEHEVQELVLVEKDPRGEVTRTSLLPVRFVPLRRDVR